MACCSTFANVIFRTELERLSQLQIRLRAAGIVQAACDAQSQRDGQAVQDYDLAQQFDTHPAIVS